MRRMKIVADAGFAFGPDFYKKGDVISVPDDIAGDMERYGAGKPASESVKSVANPDHNPIQDVLHPMPPNGPVEVPSDALAPVVEDNPGLRRQVETAAIDPTKERAVRRTGTVKTPPARIVVEDEAVKLVPNEAEGEHQPQTSPTIPAPSRGEVPPA